MKKIYTSIALTILLHAAFAQNVGIGTNDPQTKLQVDGALSIKVINETADASGNITIPEDVSIFRIAPDAFNVAINITATNPKNGQVLTIYNADGNEATFNGFVIAPTSGVVSCVYIDNSWRLVSDNTASGLGGWGITGNSGTSTTSYNDYDSQTNNFIGTTNNQDVEIYTNSSSSKDKTDIRLYTATAPTQAVSAPTDIMHIRRNGQTGVTYPLSASFALGKYNNTISSETELAIKLAAGNVYVPDVTVMTLRANGNVGIGANAPDKPLHIRTNDGSSGSIRIQRLNSDGEVGIGLYPKHANGTNSWLLTVGGWANTDDFVLGGGGGAERFIIRNTTGNVEIKSLTNGLVKSTAGVLSNATAGTDFENPLTFSGPLSRNANAISIFQANASTNGFLSSTDWNTFNSKENALTFSNGLTRTSNAVKLGGALTEATNISALTATNKMSFTGTGVDAFNVDGATFSVDATNDRIGIGTTTPNANLEVYKQDGKIRISDTRADGGTALGELGLEFTHHNINVTKTAIIAKGIYSWKRADLHFVLNSAANDNSYSVGTTAPDTKLIIKNSGNVGIGTITPIQNLDVNGRVNITNGVIQRGGAAITATQDLGLYSRIDGNWMRFVVNNSDFAWFTTEGTGGVGGTERFRIQSNGIVRPTGVPTSFGTTSNYFYTVYADDHDYKGVWGYTFDVYDDLALLDSIKHEVYFDSKLNHAVMVVKPESWPKCITNYSKPDYNPSEPFISTKKSMGLAYGAIRQLNRETKERDEKIVEKINMLFNSADISINENIIEKVIADFGNVVAEKSEVYVPFSDDFANKLGRNVPVINITPTSRINSYFVKGTTSEGFILVCENQEKEFSFNWTANAKVKTSLTANSDKLTQDVFHRTPIKNYETDKSLPKIEYDEEGRIISKK